VGVGPSLLAAAKALGEHVQLIEGSNLEIATDALSKMLEIIGQANAWGAPFSADPLPSAEALKRAAG